MQGLSPARTRSEQLAEAKRLALYYLDHPSGEAMLSQATATFTSALERHPDTEGLAQPLGRQLHALALLGEREAMRSVINGVV